MKKIFHLGAIALLVVSVSSCTKSSDYLLTDETPVVANANGNSDGKQSVSQPQLSIFNSITQPYRLELGTPNSVLNTENGDMAVFFITAPDKYLKETKVAVLSFINEATQETIVSYDLLSQEEAIHNGITIPEGLTNKDFMFVMVNLHDLDAYDGNMISIQSEVYSNAGGSTANFYEAFTYRR